MSQPVKANHIGRPRLELSEEQIEKLKIMAPYLTIEMMADSLQVNRSTFQEILKRDPVVSGIYLSLIHI